MTWEEIWCRLRKLTGRIWEGLQAGRRCQPIIGPANLPEHLTLESILAERCMSPQEGTWVRPNTDTGKKTGQKQPRKQTTTLRPETMSHVAEKFSWVPLPCYCLPECHFSIKSSALSVCVSPKTIHFQALKSPLWGPGRSPPCGNDPTNQSFAQWQYFQKQN